MEDVPRIPKEVLKMQNEAKKRLKVYEDRREHLSTLRSSLTEMYEVAQVRIIPNLLNMELMCEVLLCRFLSAENII